MGDLVLHELEVHNDEEFNDLYNQHLGSGQPPNPHMCYAFTLRGGGVSDDVFKRLRNEMIVRNVMYTAVALAYITNPRPEEMEFHLEPPEEHEGLVVEVLPFDWGLLEHVEDSEEEGEEEEGEDE